MCILLFPSFKMKPLKLANKNIKIVMSLSETIEKGAVLNEWKPV